MYVQHFSLLLNSSIFMRRINISIRQCVPVCVEAFAVPFPDRTLARSCVGVTPWDTRTLGPTPTQTSLCCKTHQSGNMKKGINNVKQFYDIKMQKTC